MNRRAPLIVGIAFLLLAVLAFFFLILPKMGEVTAAQEELEQAEQEQVGLQAELSRLEGLRRDAPRIRRQLARNRRAIPPAADLPGLINSLQDIADLAQVDFFSISPGDPLEAVGAEAAEIPATVQVIGRYFAVDEFLFRLEELPRAAKVIDVAIAEGPDGAPQIDATLTVEFYTRDPDAGPGAALPEDEGEPAAGEAPATEASPEATPSPDEGG